MMDYGIMSFGDADAAIDMVRNIFKADNEWGPFLMNGCAAVADRLDKPGEGLRGQASVFCGI